MCSRGTLGYPFLVGEVDHFLKTGEELTPPTPIERLECARDHLQALFEYKGIYGVRQARKHLTWYAKGFPGAAELRGKLAVIENVAQGTELLDRHIQYLADCDGKAFGAAARNENRSVEAMIEPMVPIS
jgi:tRNA-dihydrouridine synthase B